jgi:hypothetical protein
MKRNYSLAPAMLLLGTGGGASAQQASKSPVIVAFYPPGPLAEDASAESTESLSDFQLYARRVERPLSKAGIVFREVYATSFRVPSGLKTTTFCPRIDVGY